MKLPGQDYILCCVPFEICQKARVSGYFVEKSAAIGLQGCVHGAGLGAHAAQTALPSRPAFARLTI